MFNSILSALPSWAMLIIFAVLIVVMFVFTIVPQKKRQKEQQNMLNSLAVGTKLMTVGGLVGKITQVNADNTLFINVGTESNPTLILIDKKAVGYVLEKVDAPAPVAEESAPAEDVVCDDVDVQNSDDFNLVDDAQDTVEANVENVLEDEAEVVKNDTTDTTDAE